MAVAGGAVDLVADAARLGRVHGDVGALHQRLDVAAVLGEHRDADAGAHEQGQALEAEGLLDRAGEPAGDRPRRSSTVVPSGSRTANSSPPTRATSSASGTPASRRGPISRRSRSPAWWPSVSLSSLKWSRSISSSASLVLAARAAVGGLVEAGEQLRRLARPGQRVVHRVVLALGGERAQLVLELAAVGRVAHVEHEAVDARVVQAVGGDDVEVAVAAVAVGEAQRQVAARGRAGRRPRRSSRRARRGRRGGRGRARGCRRARRGRGRARRGSRRPASGCARSAPTIVTTSVEFWTIEVRRRWMISEARRATDSDWPRIGASAMPMARARSPSNCSSPRPAWRAEQRGHPQHVAGEGAQRAAVEAAEDDAEQREQRVARRDVQDQEDRVGLERLQREREAPAAVAADPVGGERRATAATPASFAASESASPAAMRARRMTAPTTREDEEQQPEARERRLRAA